MTVFLAQNESDLLYMLEVLSKWCNKWKVKINCLKTEIVHFRRRSCPGTKVIFNYLGKRLKVVQQYKYLRLVLDEFLDFKVTADVVAKSASRALGLLIAKCKSAGGVPFICFEKLYKSMVLPVIH